MNWFRNLLRPSVTIHRLALESTGGQRLVAYYGSKVELLEADRAAGRQPSITSRMPDTLEVPTDPDHLARWLQREVNAAGRRSYKRHEAALASQGGSEVTDPPKRLEAQEKGACR